MLFNRNNDYDLFKKVCNVATRGLSVEEKIHVIESLEKKYFDEQIE